ncbi:MAG TPA: DUF1800 domain-containing protein, partial [Gemmatimonadales bacterium]|nr:DUF1800 domain-containing protein [Gemmatimonadales bacterium]
MRLRSCGWLLALAAAPLAAQQPLTPRDSALHVLNRLAYGPTPGLIDRIAREGVLHWIDDQLAVESIDDPALAPLLAEYRLLQTPQSSLLMSFLRLRLERRAAQRRNPGDSMAADRRMAELPPEARELRQLGGQLQQLVLLRATRSDHQLAEVMADFWSNHFNVFVGKTLDRVYLPGYVEQTIRPRALGSFEDLLLATARSPAMLVYLDNAQSVAAGSRPPEPPGRLGRLRMRQLEQQRRMPTGLNENYARELLELHTLGVDGGYTQADVTEVARVLTGWSVAPPPRGGGYVFNEWAHDRKAKRVLGLDFPGGHGEDEGLRLLKLLAAHPSTMHFVSGKLCARFVRDTPPDGCIDDAVHAWKQSGGNIREVLRAIFHSPDFWAAGNFASKVKTPLEFVASAVRAVGGAPDTTPRLALAVGRLGQPLYQHVAPNGYGEQQEDWVNSGALLNRMNLGVALAAGRLPGVMVDLDAVLPVSEDRAALVDAVN